MECPLPFLLRKPFRFFRAAGQVGQQDDTQHDGRQPFNEKQPLPAGETRLALQAEKNLQPPP